MTMPTSNSGTIQQCYWCNGRFGVHASRCPVPAILATLASGLDHPAKSPVETSGKKGATDANPLSDRPLATP